MRAPASPLVAAAAGRRAQERAIGQSVLRVLRRGLEDGLDALELGLRARSAARAAATSPGVRLRRRPGTPPLRRAAVLGRRLLGLGRQVERPPRSATRSRPSRTRAAPRSPPAARRDPCDGGSRPSRRRSRAAAPPSRSAPPTIAAPVSPMSAASAPPIAIPIQPPLSLPSSVIRPEEAHPHPEPERPHVQQVAAREQSPPSARSASGSTYAASPDDLLERVGEPGADGAAVEAEVEDGREDEPERDEREPEELVLVVRACSPRPLLHARGDAWPKRPLLPPGSHAARRFAARRCRAPPRRGLVGCARARASATTRSASARLP